LIRGRGAGHLAAEAEERSVTEDEVRGNAFAMPLTSPAYPKGPYRFIDREFLIITHRTDPERLRAAVPEPLAFDPADPIVKSEFFPMPDSTGFGDYTETGQVIPVTYQGRAGGYTHAMFLNDHPPIAGGRELWGFPNEFFPHALAPLAEPPVRSVVSAAHLAADLTLGLGTVVHDCLA
jgi:acetoacetate decarboxylase